MLEARERLRPERLRLAAGTIWAVACLAACAGAAWATPLAATGELFGHRFQLLLGGEDTPWQRRLVDQTLLIEVGQGDAEPEFGGAVR